jgi:FtsZ-binding cell division protein ZapB
MMARPQSPGLPPLPPPVKTAGPLYGIPIHPLVMFKTHDNKLSEHELSIGDCFEQLKEIDERLTAVESSNGHGADRGEVEVAGGGGDLNDLMNDDVFINGIVDNIMNTTNFASIVENVIPLKEENEALKQQVSGLHQQVDGLHQQLEEWKERMQQLEDQIRSICSGASAAAANTPLIFEPVPSDEKCNDSEGEDRAEEEEEYLKGVK